MGDATFMASVEILNAKLVEQSKLLADCRALLEQLPYVCTGGHSGECDCARPDIDALLARMPERKEATGGS